MKLEDFEKLEETRKHICSKVAQLQISRDLQMVAATDIDACNNYWLMSPEVTNDISIPLAIWHSDSGVAQHDYEFKDWHEMIAWLFERYTDGRISEIYNEHL